jgi:hypothetical protein
MDFPLRYIHSLFFPFLLFVLPFKSFGQADTLSQPGNPGSHEIKPAAKIHSLYSGLGFGSNMIYLGSSISHNKPFYSASLIYGYKNSFYSSVSASHLSGVDPFLAFYGLSVNYSHVFNFWFDISADLAGYLTPASLNEILFSDFAFINLTTGFDWKLLYTQVSFGEMISQDNKVYLQVKNSRYFETPEFFNGKAQVSFDPGVDLLFGEYFKIVTTSGPAKYGVSPPFRHLKKNPGNTTELHINKFGLIDFEFFLPVTLDCNKFSIEAETTYILPSYTNPDYPSPKGVSFYLSAYFIIF